MKRSIWIEQVVGYIIFLRANIFAHSENNLLHQYVTNEFLCHVDFLLYKHFYKPTGSLYHNEVVKNNVNKIKFPLIQKAC